MVRFHLSALLALGALSACNGEDNCKDDEKIDAWADVDGDGYGAGDATQVCALEVGQVDNGDDCDDANPDAAPGAIEACNGLDDDCDGAPDNGLKIVDWFPDADLDGYGTDAKTLTVCAPPDDHWARFSGDCDDQNENVSPNETEICNAGIDDDCDLLIDDDDDSIDVASFHTYYPDGDDDGFPRQGTSLLACVAPEGAAEAVDFDADGDNDFDCVDTNAAVNPAAQEICNAGVDDDCDTLRDDLDDTLDTSGQTVFPADTDHDGEGDAVNTVMACNANIQSGAADNTLDCDDTNALVNTGADEVLCDLIDNDCDAVSTDDRDIDLDGWSVCNGDCADNNAERNPDTVEIASNGVDENCDGNEVCYVDADMDGSRSDLTVNVADLDCNDAGNARENQPRDCNDADAAITISGDWWADGDLDTYGNGVVVLSGVCADPGAGYTLDTSELDCDDARADVNPGITDDACNDGVDADCNTLDSCATCLEYLETGSTATGVYPLRPPGGSLEEDVYCDMDTDGGGWTLVASSIDLLNDVGVPFHSELNTLSPTGGHPGVWNGLANQVVVDSDLRFACKVDPLDAGFAVDLSFYATPWYGEIAAATTDAQSCFSEGGFADNPARRNNLTGEFKDTTDVWDSGALVGEDACNSNDDFTVDFDDRGMDGASESDGTDWGEDDTKPKCGSANVGGAWFIFVRE